jgi:small subunit ribosomal protein S4
MANKKQGITGNNLIQICETRLDNVVTRLGFAMSRPEARQLVVHGHFTVNGQKVDIPSYLVKVGDVVAFKAKSLDSSKIKAILEANASKPMPKWLTLDKENLTGTVSALPEIEDVTDLPIEVHLIVELYSK